MAFPTVINTANTVSGGSVSSFPLTMPASIVAGRLLLAVACAALNDSATTAMSGWTKVGSAQRTSGFGTLAVFAKSAAGGDTGTVTGTLALRSATTYQIDDWSGSIADIQLVVSGTVATLDPPSLTPGFGALDYLWIAAARNGAAVTGAPTNYGSLLTAGGGSNPVMASAVRSLNASSEDPGVFAGSASSPVTATIAIAPVATVVAAPPPQPENRARLIRASCW